MRRSSSSRWAGLSKCPSWHSMYASLTLEPVGLCDVLSALKQLCHLLQGSLGLLPAAAADEGMACLWASAK